MSNIEWTEKTWNPVIGCTAVSAGCLNCYAATMARRLEAMGQKDYQPRVANEQETAAIGAVHGVTESDDDLHARRTIRIAEVRGGRPVFTGEVRCLEHRLTEPLRWKKPTKVFVNSMSDLFHEAVPFEFIDKVWAVMALCPHHTFQVLTKRPERMAEYLERPTKHLADGRRGLFESMNEWAIGALGRAVWPSQSRGMIEHRGWPLPNVWLGTSVESDDQHKRAWDLLKCPAAVRFLSCEPLIGPVDLNKWELLCKTWRRGATIGTYIDWVIVGGESGPNARPCDVTWVRSIVQQCKAAGVPCFVKQLGSNAGCMHANRRELVGTAGCRVCGFAPPHADRKGGTPDEWPEDLRVREMPKAVQS